MPVTFEPRTTTKRFIPTLCPYDQARHSTQGLPHYWNSEHLYTPAAEARKWHIQGPSNDSAATSCKTTASNRIGKLFRKLSSPRTREQNSTCRRPESVLDNPTQPEPSPFNYLIDSFYAPKGYYLVEDRYRRPWGVMLRIFLVNLPHQEGSDSHEPERWEDETCNDSGDEKDTDKWFHALETAPDTKKRHPGVPWRDYAPANTQLAVAFGMETPCGTYMCGCCQQWGRRNVFEPELPPPGRQQDRWLAVAYVIGKDRRWVEDVDVRDIISFESSHW